MSLWVTLLSGVAGSTVTGIFGWLMWQLQVKKFQAEIHKIDAETHKLEVETDGLVSGRLIRELDSLQALLAQQRSTIDRQEDRIEQLRAEILAYAARETQHAIENAALRKQLEIYETPTSTIGVSLRQAFTAEIPHTTSEYDDDGQASTD